MFLICGNKLDFLGKPDYFAFKFIVVNRNIVFICCFFEVVDIRLNLLDLTKNLFFIGEELIFFLNQHLLFVVVTSFCFLNLLFHFFQMGDKRKIRFFEGMKNIHQLVCFLEIQVIFLI